MSSSFKLKGGADLSAFLDHFPAKIVKKVVRGGMRKGAAVIRDEAKKLVPTKSGLTRKSIKTSDDVLDGVVTAKVSLRGPHAFLGPMIEYGVAPHFISIADEDTPTTKGRRGTRKVGIRTANKMAKRGSLVISGKFVGDTVHHPGTPAKPFMRPALDTKGQEAIEAIGKYIADRLRLGELDPPLVEVDEE